MKKNAFTVIELLAIIVVLSIILIIAVPRVMGAIDEAKKEAFKLTGEQLIKEAKKDSLEDMFEEDVETTYTILSGAFLDNSFIVNGDLPNEGVIRVNPEGGTAIAIHNGKYCASKTYDEKNVTISNDDEEECYVKGIPPISYSGFSKAKKTNVPYITKGLTPVKWDGNAWITTTASDPEWYSYTTTSKKWANAVSDDGSLWVWIPRFAYQVNTNYHIASATGGVVNIKFLMGNTDEALDETVIGETPTYTGSSQTNYVVHPAFSFGDKEVSGFWMAKFEATMGKTPYNAGTSCGNSLDNVTTEEVKIINNISAWRCISVSNAFTNSFNMQTKESIYGWLDSQVDTHLIKETEWSAVAYFAQSEYGKGTPNIWLNPNSAYKTGCSGTADGQNETATCIPYYTEPRTGTTGNVYGVFDMSGGSEETTAAYINNTYVSGSLYANGVSLIEAEAKYKDVYPIGTTDSALDNYNATQNKFGYTIWEISTSSAGYNGWYSDSSIMPAGSRPFPTRGAFNRSYNGAGLFAIFTSGGGGAPDVTFRPIILVGHRI